MTGGRRPADSSPGACLVTVGDELLLGRTVDTNAAWLGRHLAERGVPVLRRWTVPDERDAIQAAVRAAVDHAPLVVVSGGLGPTPDDITREAVAELLDRPLVVDTRVLDRIHTRFRERGLEELPEPNRKVAQVPAGARILENPHGTAPGLAMEMDGGGGGVVLLPGVPRELEGTVEGSLDGLLEDWFGSRRLPVHIRTLHTTGVPESLLAERISQLQLPESENVSLAFLPDRRGVDLRLTAIGLDAAEADRRFDAWKALLTPVLDAWLFEADSGDLVESVSTRLRSRGMRVAVAGSCTGGLLSERLTVHPGASEIFVGGVVAYADQAKVELLDVGEALLHEHGAVSEPVAEAMARGVARRLGAEVGVGVTGVAGPGGGTALKPVGTVCLAVYAQGRSRMRSERFPGDREEVRDRSAQAALALLHKTVDDLWADPRPPPAEP